MQATKRLNLQMSHLWNKISISTFCLELINLTEDNEKKSKKV